MGSTQQVRAGAAYVELTTKNTAFIKGLEAAKKRLMDFGSATRMIGMRLFGMGTAATAPLAASVAVFASFDDAMLTVKSVSQATAAELETLRNKAKELGATTSFTAIQVASLMTELGRAGFKPDQIVEMTGAIMDMARATGTDATVASGIMAATIRQFGLEATDATRVADGFTAAANKTFNSVESLGEAFQYAGPVAADANMSLEETLAILGTLGNVGIQGSEAGTALRRLLTLSASEAEKFSKVFGVATTDAAGNTRPLVDVLGDVAEATKKLPTGERMAKFNEVFGLLGITSASAIGKSVVDTRALYKELLDVNGIASKTAKEMDSGIGGAFRILRSSVEGIAIAIGEALSGSLKAMSDSASKSLSGIIKWIEKNHEIVKLVAKVTVGVMLAGAAIFAIGTLFSAAGLAIGGVTAVFGVFTGAITVVASLFGAILSPMGLLIVAAVALGTYLVYASDVGSQALAWLADRFAVLKDDALKSWNAIGAALASGNIAFAGRILWLMLKMEWQRGVNYLTGLWLGFKKSFLDIASNATFGAAKLLTDATAGLESGWVETVGFLADSWSLFVNMLTQTWNTTVGFIRKAWTQLKSLFDEDINVQAEVKKIDAETNAKNAASETSMLDAIGKRDQERQQRQSKIESDRTGAQTALDQMQATEQQQREQQFNQDMATSQQQVDQAKGEWQAAIAEAQAPADPAKDNIEGKKPKMSLPEIASSLAASRTALGDQQRKIESKGGFNAIGLAGLGADSLSQRTAQATEQVAMNTKVLTEQAKRGRLVFTE